MSTLPSTIPTPLGSAHKELGGALPRRGIKILTIFGTRPEVIKLAPVISHLESSGLSFQTVNVTSAQHTDLLYPLVRLFGVRLDYDLQVMTHDQTPTIVCSRVLAAFDPVLDFERPDLILVQGDTTTALAGALAGFYRHIPVGHVEAGLRTLDTRNPYPEEMNRQLMTSLASYHFAATRSNRETLLAEGVARHRVFVTGNPVIESDEIVTTSITDMGALAPVLYQGAIPVFADVEPHTYNVSARTIEPCLSTRTRAIIVTHLFGNPCDMGEIMKLADARGIPVIEGCAQAFLASHDGRMVGGIGAVGCFSLQQGKHITTGEGGFVTTNDDALARRMFLFINKAWGYGDAQPDHYFLALNYRMTELQGAVALAQLDKLEDVVEKRVAAAGRLTRMLHHLHGIETPLVNPKDAHTYWKYCLRVDPQAISDGAAGMARLLKERGIASAPRYIQKPAFMCEVFQKQRTFGQSRHPFTVARPDVDCIMQLITELSQNPTRPPSTRVGKDVRRRVAASESSPAAQRWAVVGGGMLGMTIALRLTQAGHRVVLYEGANRLGGLASAWRLGSVVWDRHYHVTLLSDTELRGLLRELDLEQELKWVETRTGFYTDGKLYSMSNTIEFLRFPPLNLFDKLRLGGTIF